jgi:hypothetical protein|eukprot:TRINITY_DN67454_c0_g1_i1.p1 TRINITY_DN67454_c0_g1~~TRINITY_DN67454_c0_g1_i1.p1  ORF type:complete len:319 (+),score=50.51 TRINITY_DN67454_c0_g1_i1:48-1004(+)
MTKARDEMSAAACAMTVASIVFNPCDVVKTKLQTQNQLSTDVSKRLYTSSLHCARRVIAEDGLIRGLWSPGLSATIARDIINGGIRMGGFPSIMRNMHESLPWADPSMPPSFSTKVLAGILAGFVGALVGNPTDVVKVRLQSEAGTVKDGVYVTGLKKGQPPSPGTLGCLRQIVEADGVRTGLFRGAGTNCIRAALITSAQMSTFTEVKEKLAGVQSGVFANEATRVLFASFVSGVCAASVAAPSDLVRSRIMDDARKPGEALYSGALDCVMKTVRVEGPFGLWKGWSAAYLRLGPHFMISLPLLELLRTRLFGLPPM